MCRASNNSDGYVGMKRRGVKVACVESIIVTSRYGTSSRPFIQSSVLSFRHNFISTKWPYPTLPRKGFRT